MESPRVWKYHNPEGKILYNAMKVRVRCAYPHKYMIQDPDTEGYRMRHINNGNIIQWRYNESTLTLSLVIRCTNRKNAGKILYSILAFMMGTGRRHPTNLNIPLISFMELALDRNLRDYTPSVRAELCGAVERHITVED